MSWTIESIIKLEQKFVWLVLFLTALYFWATRNFGFWASKGVIFKRPVPFFGNIAKLFFNIVPRLKNQQEIYNYFKDAPYGGYYEFSSPHLMIKDPELIERIMIKDFSSFMDRAMGVDPDSDGLNAHLLNMNGQRWKSLRNKLAPVFTSGKLKMMIKQLEDCSDNLTEHLIKKAASNEPLEAKYEMSGYTLDVIGSCAFGLDFNAIKDPNSKFRLIGEKVFAPSRINMLKGWLRRKAPKILDLLNLRGATIDVRKYFTNLMKDTIKLREDNKIQRNDFVQLLMEVRKNDMNHEPAKDEVIMDDRVLTSNSFVFLLAGYETTASTLSFLIYELAVNQDIQEKVFKECADVLKKHNGEISWESIKNMVYLEQTISETLRKYPPAVEIRRTCMKPYRFPDDKLELEPGDRVTIPVYSLHHDPQYYPEPEKFDPERFSEANHYKIVKYTYLPFGGGPRICIGMRFALVEIKVAITKLLQDFSITLHPKTISPLKFNPEAILLSPVGGIWVNFIPRKKQN